MSPAGARALQLAAQGLLQKPRRKARKADLLDAIRRMGALQIDTISVVARSPYLVLWSRLGHYRTAWLDELLAAGSIFEYWAHAACFLPVEDYPLYRRAMLDRVHPWWKRVDEWLARHREDVDHVLARVRQDGALRAADFEPPPGHKGGTWWAWKPQKLALELLHTAGDLMIARREGFQRVYDLRERVLPEWSDDRLPSHEATDRAFVLKTVKALGVTRAAWVADYFRQSKRSTPALVERLAQEGALLRVEVSGWSHPAYVHPDHADLVEQAVAGTLRPTLTTLLSPFDPIVWDRARASVMFDFDYRIECYTPAPKRQYGYYVLPILRRGALIGRLDAKAHRRDGIFEVRALHLEEGVKSSHALATDIAGALRDCADWHGTPEVVMGKSSPPAMKRLIEGALKGEKRTKSKSKSKSKS